MDDHNYIKEEEKSVEKDIHNEEIFTYKEFNQNFIGKANSKRALWSCLICGTDFSWISQKDSHIRGVHSRIKTVKCAFCQVRFFYRSHRLRHMKLEHLTKYRCEKCKFQATTHARLMQHSIHSHRWKPSVEKSKLEEDDIPITDVEFVKSRQRSQTSRILKRAKTMKFDKLAASMSKIPAHSTTNKESQLAEEPTRNTYVPQNSQPEPETNFYAIFLQRYVETDPIDESRRYCKICEFDMHFCCVSKHFKDVHESKFHYSCSLCDDRFICPLQRINHMKLKHPDKNVCEHCSHQFNHAETYERHMAQCVEERNLPMKSQLREQKEDETPVSFCMINNFILIFHINFLIQFPCIFRQNHWNTYQNTQLTRQDRAQLHPVLLPAACSSRLKLNSTLQLILSGELTLIFSFLTTKISSRAQFASLLLRIDEWFCVIWRLTTKCQLSHVPDVLRSFSSNWSSQNMSQLIKRRRITINRQNPVKHVRNLSTQWVSCRSTSINGTTNWTTFDSSRWNFKRF